jgi:hypothetical protein
MAEGRDYARLLVDQLNVLARSAVRGAKTSGVEHRKDEAWREVALMLERSPDAPGRLSDASIRLFNKRAAESPGVLHLSDQDIFEEDDSGKRTAVQGVPGINFNHPHAFPFYVLWRVLESRLLDRVKRCPECRRWFVDDTRNKSAARCSRDCTVKWWNRSRRKAATHAQYRRRKPR